MISKTLRYIIQGLNEFLLSDVPSPVINPQNDSEPIILENIAKIEDPTFEGNNKMVLSLVNLEEESALKNRPAFTHVNGIIEYKRPPVTFNLSILISANINDYTTALEGLTKVAAFFQSKNCFTYNDAPPSGDESIFTDEEAENFKIYFDLYTLTFEQLNHLWGSLGGKQVPSVMYKIRVAPVEHERILADGRPIESIRRNGSTN